MRYLFALLALVLILTMTGGCKAKKNLESPSTETVIPSVIIDENYMLPEDNDAFKIISISVEGDILLINVTFGGGCEAHDFKMYTRKMYAKSMPPQLDLLLEHDAKGDMCKAIVSETLRFDLQSTRYPGKEKEYTIILSVNNTKERIEYKY